VAERTRELAEANRRLADEIADRRQAEAALWHTQKLDLIGQLTGGIAHDFNNLLMVISGNLELVHQGFDDGAKLSSARRARLRQLLATAEAATDHAAKITQQLLAFARRSTVFTTTSVGVADLLAVSQGFLRRAAGEAIEVDFACASGLWHCHVDPIQLEAAILNLVVNARDAMPRGGKLRIESVNVSVDATGSEAERGVPAGDYVQIIVSDTGRGMAPEVLERVFEPFFTTKEVGKGSGLGLSQVYGFLRQSDGHILIDSTPGEGTAISLYLPRSALSAEPSATEDGRPHNAPGGNETVLIVDDNEDVREVTAVIIESLGYNVLTAGDAPEALAIIGSQCGIHLLVSDIVMSGGIDGFGLVERARMLLPGLPVLLMSGYPAGSAEKCHIPILHKPYRRDELARHIRAALGDPVVLA